MVAAGLLSRAIVNQVDGFRRELRGHEGHGSGRQLTAPRLGQKAHQAQYAQLQGQAQAVNCAAKRHQKQAVGFRQVEVLADVGFEQTGRHGLVAQALGGGEKLLRHGLSKRVGKTTRVFGGGKADFTPEKVALQRISFLIGLVYAVGNKQ